MGRRICMPYLVTKRTASFVSNASAGRPRHEYLKSPNERDADAPPRPSVVSRTQREPRVFPSERITAQIMRVQGTRLTLPGSGLLFLLPWLASVARGAYVLDGRTLPDGFIFSCGTSAYQIEGATGSKAEGGKGTSIWDTFAHEKGLGHIAHDETGDIAVDF